jgi:hypothetical protein
MDAHRRRVYDPGLSTVEAVAKSPDASLPAWLPICVKIKLFAPRRRVTALVPRRDDCVLHLRHGDGCLRPERRQRDTTGILSLESWWRGIESPRAIGAIVSGKRRPSVSRALDPLLYRCQWINGALCVYEREMLVLPSLPSVIAKMQQPLEVLFGDPWSAAGCGRSVRRLVVVRRQDARELCPNLLGDQALELLGRGINPSVFKNFKHGEATNMSEVGVFHPKEWLPGIVAIASIGDPTPDTEGAALFTREPDENLWHASVFERCRRGELGFHSHERMF